VWDASPVFPTIVGAAIVVPSVRVCLSGARLQASRNRRTQGGVSQLLMDNLVGTTIRTSGAVSPAT